MSYELRHEQSLGGNLQRICRKQIDRALAIAHGADETDDTPVHDIRRHLKKARAAMRLVRREVGGGLFRRPDHYLRDVGRIVSEIRDAEVRLQTVRQLQQIMQRHDGSRSGSLEAMLMLELESVMAAFAEWQREAVPMLEKARAAIESWTLDHFSNKQLRRALQASYKSARNALGAAKECPSTETFHQLRAKAKRLGYQLRLLCPVNRIVLQTLIDELKSLGELLGRLHDLSFLSRRLEKEDGPADWQREGRKLLALIAAREVDLRRDGIELAERLFAQRPRDFGERVCGWLGDWTTKSGSVGETLFSPRASG